MKKKINQGKILLCIVRICVHKEINNIPIQNVYKMFELFEWIWIDPGERVRLIVCSFEKKKNEIETVFELSGFPLITIFSVYKSPHKNATSNCQCLNKEKKYIYIFITIRTVQNCEWNNRRNNQVLWQQTNNNNQFTTQLLMVLSYELYYIFNGRIKT